MLRFRKVPLAKMFMDKRGEGGKGGVSRFSVEIVLSHIAEKLRIRTLQCLTNFGYRKILCFRALCHDCLSNDFI